MEQQQLLTERQAATLLSMSQKTLQDRRLRGAPPKFCKLGSSVRYDIRDLQEWIDSCRRTSTSDRGPADA